MFCVLRFLFSKSLNIKMVLSVPNTNPSEVREGQETEEKNEQWPRSISRIATMLLWQFWVLIKAIHPLE
jgi:hypothetical protein